MKMMRTSSGIPWSWIAITTFLIQVVTGASAVSEDDWEALIKNGIYLQSIKGDTAEAVEIYERIIQGEGPEKVLKAEAVYRLMECYLQMHQEDKARKMFQALQSRYADQKDWYQAALAKVPDSFLHREIPWKEGERAIYCWTSPEGKRVGYAVLAVSKVQKEDGIFWRLESRMIGNNYRRYIIDFEPDSLQPSYSFYQLRRFDSLETEQRRILGIRGDDNALVNNACDHEAVGLLLRQFPFQLGYSIEADLFKASEGGGLPARIDVTSIETFELPDGGKVGCYAVETNIEGESCRFWFENTEDKPMLKFRIANLSGERESTEIIGKEESHRVGIPSLGMHLTCPSEWFPLLKPGIGERSATGVVFLMPSLDVSFWIEETVESVADEDIAGQFEQFCQSNGFEGSVVRKLGESLPGLSPKGFVMTAKKTIGREQRAIFRSRLIVDGQNFVAVGHCSAEQLEIWAPRFERVLVSLRKD